MNYDVYQSLKDTVKPEDFYTKFKGLKSLLFWLSFAGNLFCIVFAYFHVNGSILETISTPTPNTVLGIMALSIFVLFALEALKRLVFAKLTRTLVEHRMRWVGGELNALAAASLVLVAASFYLSLTGAQQYADKEDKVTSQVQGNVSAYQDSAKVQTERKISTLDERSARLSQTNAGLNEKALTLSTSRRADLMQAIAANNRLLAKNDEAVKELKKERDVDVAKFETRAKDQGGAVVAKSKQNVVRFVSFSALAEIIILFGVFFVGYFPYRAKVEYDRLFDSDPKYRTFEHYKELLQIIFKAGAQAGGYVITKIEMLKMLRLANVNPASKELDDMVKVLRHLDILRQRGSKNVFNVEHEKAVVLVKDYLKVG